jgi:hypothetical protein
MAAATAAAVNQVPSHRSADDWRAATTAAVIATIPIPTPPAPGMDVKVALRSIVCRM